MTSLIMLSPLRKANDHLKVQAIYIHLLFKLINKFKMKKKISI
jgi:hypothetical protein